MLKRELKVNLKSFLLWTGILITIFLVVFMIYPTLMESEEMKNVNELLEIFPKEVLMAFNMDISGIDSAYGWLKSEGYIFILLVTSCYASMLGANIVLKEESEKTIEYLYSLPVSRKQIMIEKIKCAILYIVMMCLIIGIFNYICLKISGSFDETQYFYLAIAPLLPAFVFFSLALLIATFFHKTKKMLGISLGIVFLSYFIQVLSQMSSKIEFLKYGCVFTLANTRTIIEGGRLEISCILISLLLVIICLCYSIQRYMHKDLV